MRMLVPLSDQGLELLHVYFEFHVKKSFKADVRRPCFRVSMRASMRRRLTSCTASLPTFLAVQLRAAL